MKAGTREAILRYIMALQAVLLAALAAHFSRSLPAAYAGFVVAIIVTTWLAGVAPAAAAATLSLGILMLLFPEIVTLSRIALFVLASAAVCFAAILIRRAGAEPLPDDEAPTAPGTEPASLSDARRGGRAGARVLTLAAFPLLVFVIYTNISDILARQLAIPSILQILIVVTAIGIWRHARALPVGEIALHPLTLLLAGYCVVVFASTIWAADIHAADERTIDGVKNFSMYALAAILAASWTSLRRALAVLVAAAAALSSLTLLQAVTGYSREFFGLARLQMAPIYGDVLEMRASGPVGDPNFYAQMLVMVVPIGLFLAVGERRRRQRAMYVIAVILILTGVALTYSRGAMVALAVVALLVIVATPVARRRLAAVGAAAILLLFVPLDMGERFLTIDTALDPESVERDSSVVKRRLLAASAWQMFSERSILGVGAGNFARHFHQYANRVGSSAEHYDEPGSRQYPHNLYLEIASENGLAGLATFGGALVLALVGIYRARSRLLQAGDTAHAAIAVGVGAGLAGYMISSVFLHGAFQRYLWLLVAFAAAVERLSRRTTAAPRVEANG